MMIHLSRTLPLIADICLGFAILSLIGRCDAIRITRIKVPGRSSNTTNISTSCDLPAGCTITVECDDPSQTLRYDTHVLAQNKRFNGSRARRNRNGKWRLSDLRPYDTGLLSCYHRNNDSAINSSLYVFVNSADQKSLSVPIRNPGYYNYIFGTYFPCLPTSSQTNLTVRLGSDSHGFTEGVNYTVDQAQGFKLLRAPQHSPQYFNCVYTYQGVLESHRYLLYTVELDKLPEPQFVPIGGKNYYRVGENLTLMCSIMYEDTKHIVYKYPASDCPLYSTDAFGCDALRNTSRVTMNGLRRTKYGSHNLTSTLHIQNLQVFDNGQYVCQYMVKGDDQFRKFAYQHIQVFESPLIDLTADEVKVTGIEHDDTLTLTSRVEALTPPLISWKFNSVDIEMGAKYGMSIRLLDEALYEVKLKVRALALTDRGPYEMTASLEGKHLSLQFTVTVNAPPKLTLLYTYNNHTIPVTGEIKTVYSKPNNTLAVDCKTIGGSPPPEVTWYWQNCDYERACDMDDNSWVLINSTARGVQNQPYTHTTNPGRGKLRLTTQRSGWLRCSGSNVVTESSETLRLAVSALPEDYEGIGFSGNTKKVAAQLVEGDVIVLPCVVSRFSCPEDNVQIIRSSHEVYDRKSDHILDWDVGTDSYRLSISLNASVDMNGHEYACRCKHGRQGPVVTLEVKEFVAPSWVKKVEGEAKITSGQTYTMVCRAAGTPLPTITWYREDKRLQVTETALISKDSYNLTLLRVTPEDSGKYTCKAATVDRRSSPLYSTISLTVADVFKLSRKHTAIIAIIAVVSFVTTLMVSSLVVRRFCRQKYVPHVLLVPSKDTINPDLPIDEQTDALPYDQKWEFPFKNLKLGMLLGQGAFGRVLKAQAMNIKEGVTSTTVAVKAVRDPEDGKQIKSLISELKILIHIGQHLNILNLLGACTKGIRKGCILVIVEYCEHGNLRSYLLEHKDYFSPALTSSINTRVLLESAHTRSGSERYTNECPGNPTPPPTRQVVTLGDLFSWSYQIARGMEYLASINYIHRDLAARNVLLANDNVVKICDFGLSKDIYKYQEYQKQSEGPLPVKWMALESLTHKVFNVRTDVWAYGVTIWELFSLAATPYPGWEIDDTFINKLQDGYRMERPEHCPQDVYKTVLLQCWSVNPERRPRFRVLADMMSQRMNPARVERLRALENKYPASPDPKTEQKRSLCSLSENMEEKLEIEYLSPISLEKMINRQSVMAKYYNMSTIDTVEDNELLDLPAGRAPSPPPMTASSPHTFPECNCSEHSSPGNSPNMINTSGPPSYSYVMDRKSSCSTHSGTTASLPDEVFSYHPSITDKYSGSRDNNQTLQSTATSSLTTSSSTDMSATMLPKEIDVSEFYNKSYGFAASSPQVSYITVSTAAPPRSDPSGKPNSQLESYSPEMASEGQFPSYRDTRQISSKSSF